MSTSTVPGKTWFRIENKAADSADIFLYDEIGSWGTSANDFVKELRDVKASAIDVHINSPGGECYDGLAIFNALRGHKANVTVYIDGLAASAASFVAMAGDRIVAERNATVMIHNAHAVGVGDAEDMRKMADMLDRMSETIAGIYAERAGGTVAQWRARMKTETWFSADEAVAAGLVDEVAAAPPPKGMPRSTWDLSIFNFAGRDNAPDPFEALLADEPAPVEPAVATAPEVVQPPELVVDEQPLVFASFDPAQFRDAVKASAVLPFDPAGFRDTLHGLARDAPAPPDIAPRHLDLGPPAPPPSGPPPEPPDLTPWDHLRAAVRTLAKDAPAPPQPNSTTTQSPAEEPGFFMDATAFTTALRRAKL